MVVIHSARSVRRNHFSRLMGTAMERKPTPAPFKSSHLDDYCSANNGLPEGQPGCGRTGRTARILNAPSYPTASQNDPKGLYFTVDSIQQHLPKGLDFIVVYVFRWPCYQMQADTPVDVWSNHACQVALFFPSVSTACSGRSVHLRSSPASGNAPLGSRDT